MKVFICILFFVSGPGWAASDALSAVKDHDRDCQALFLNSLDLNSPPPPERFQTLRLSPRTYRVQLTNEANGILKADSNGTNYRYAAFISELYQLSPHLYSSAVRILEPTPSLLKVLHQVNNPSVAYLSDESRTTPPMLLALDLPGQLGADYLEENGYQLRKDLATFHLLYQALDVEAGDARLKKRLTTEREEHIQRLQELWKKASDRVKKGVQEDVASLIPVLRDSKPDYIGTFIDSPHGLGYEKISQLFHGLAFARLPDSVQISLANQWAMAYTAGIHYFNARQWQVIEGEAPFVVTLPADRWGEGLETTEVSYSMTSPFDPNIDLVFEFDDGFEKVLRKKVSAPLKRFLAGLTKEDLEEAALRAEFMLDDYLQIEGMLMRAHSFFE